MTTLPPLRVCSTVLAPFQLLEKMRLLSFDQTLKPIVSVEPGSPLSVIVIWMVTLPRAGNGLAGSVMSCTFPLLTKYPELDETPQVPPDNPDIYCRSWCPSNPKTNAIVFPLLDEIAAFIEHLEAILQIAVGELQRSCVRGERRRRLDLRVIDRRLRCWRAHLQRDPFLDGSRRRVGGGR